MWHDRYGKIKPRNVNSCPFSKLGVLTKRFQIKVTPTQEHYPVQTTGRLLEVLNTYSENKSPQIVLIIRHIKTYCFDPFGTQPKFKPTRKSGCLKILAMKPHFHTNCTSDMNRCRANEVMSIILHVQVYGCVCGTQWLSKQLSAWMCSHQIYFQPPQDIREGKGAHSPIRYVYTNPIQSSGQNLLVHK